MSPKDLPEAYLKKCNSRLKALKVLFDDESYSDVVREAQEMVELVSKEFLDWVYWTLRIGTMLHVS